MVKFGIRKPNINKRIKARTTGRAKRAVKRSISPTYGKKGVGWAKNPKRAAYNKVYNKTTVGIGSGKKSHSYNYTNSDFSGSGNGIDSGISNLSVAIGCSVFILYVISIFFPWLFIITFGLHLYVYRRRKKEMQEAQERFEKEIKTQEAYDKKQEMISSLNRTKQGIESLFEKMEKTKEVDTFFNYFEEYKVWVSFYNKKKVVSEKEPLVEELIDEIENLIDIGFNTKLKDFIKRYERFSLERASKLKTEKGQKNNYQRSLDDLNEYEEHFDESIKRYIDNRWQEL